MINYNEGILRLKYTEFKKKHENGERFSVYLIDGEDAFFREKAWALIKDTLVSEPMLNLATFDGQDMDENQFIASLYQYPFMSEYRVTLVRDYYPKAEKIKGKLQEFITNPPSGEALVIINEKTHEAFKKYDNICHVECKREEAPIIVRWIKAKCTANGVAISDQTANLLAEYCLLDMTRISQETEKLIHYAFDKKVIERQDVDNNVHKDTEVKIYELTDAIGKKKFDVALSIISDMSDRNEPPIRILNSIYNYFRRLLLVAISDLRDSEIAEIFSIKEYAVKKAREQAKMFKKVALKKTVDMLIEIDYKIKAGYISQESSMWLAVFKIMTGE